MQVAPVAGSAGGRCGGGVRGGGGVVPALLLLPSLQEEATLQHR